MLLLTAIYKARGFALEHYNFWLKWFSFLFLCWLDNFLSLLVCVSTVFPGVKHYRQNIKTPALPSFERLFIFSFFLPASSLSISIYFLPMFVKFFFQVLIAILESLCIEKLMWSTGFRYIYWWWNDERHQKGGKTQGAGREERKKYFSKRKFKPCTQQVQTVLGDKPREILSFP